MRNNKKDCIFEHEDFVYVCNFEHMIMWIITDQDEANPASALKIRRHSPGVWAYTSDEESENYQIDNDLVLGAKIEKHYEQFVNTIIVGKNGRTAKNPLKEIRFVRLYSYD